MMKVAEKRRGFLRASYPVLFEKMTNKRALLFENPPEGPDVRADIVTETR